MSKKKQTKPVEVVEEQPIEQSEQQPDEQPIEQPKVEEQQSVELSPKQVIQPPIIKKPKPQPKKPEPIYLVDTLIKLEEIEKYGLNQYFIHAILPNKTYTLSEAKARIEACIKGFKK